MRLYHRCLLAGGAIPVDMLTAMTARMLEPMRRCAGQDGPSHGVAAASRTGGSTGALGSVHRGKKSRGALLRWRLECALCRVRFCLTFRPPRISTAGGA
eukprot:2337713-Prymnesium_polylepis.1